MPNPGEPQRWRARLSACSKANSLMTADDVKAVNCIELYKTLAVQGCGQKNVVAPIPDPAVPRGRATPVSGSGNPSQRVRFTVE